MYGRSDSEQPLDIVPSPFGVHDKHRNGDVGKNVSGLMAAACAAGAGPGADTSSSILDAGFKNSLLMRPAEERIQEDSPNESAPEVPPLGPVGAGGWHFEDAVTEEMKQVASKALEMHKESYGEPTLFEREFLTSATLPHYVDPMAPRHLANALKARAHSEDVLSARRPIYLGCSWRIIGWDRMGASVIASEPCSFKKSMGYMLDQFAYAGWSALDTNKPGAHGFSVIMDLGGGFNPLHFYSLKAIFDLAALLEGQWRRRINAILIVDMPASFKVFVNLTLPLLKETTRKKIRIVTMEEAAQEVVDMGCDDETIAYTKAYLAARRRKSEKPKYSPVIDYSFFRERLAGLQLSQDTEYLTEEMHVQLRGAIQEFRLHRWGIPERQAAAAVDGDSAS